MSFSESQPHVLYVDDDASLRAAFRRSIRGCRVVLAKDPEEAVHEAKQHVFSLVAVDYALPSMNGVALIEKLRELQPGAKFVLVTGCVEGLLDLGEFVSEVIPKPWDRATLQSCLQGASDS